MVIYLDNMNLEKIFNFIKEKKGRDYPLRFKLINGYPLSKDELNIKKNLDLFGKDITSLPDNLKVGGFMSLSRTKITTLPDNLEVRESLFLNNTMINSISDNLKVGGSLYIVNTPLSKNYSIDEIRDMVEKKGGFISRRIVI